MARHFKVHVKVDGLLSGEVIVGTLRVATSLMVQNALKGRTVTITPTINSVTHKNASYAQACIEMYQMGLPLNNEGTIIDAHA